MNFRIFDPFVLIPLQLGSLNRLKTFSVANNLLTGQVPTFASLTVSPDNYANNLGLCGGPLKACSGASKRSHTAIIIGAAAVGGMTVAVIGVGIGITGTMYKAMLEDGTSLMVKRLRESQHSEKEFMSEMATLGSVKHRNLVPLLGFCMAEKEKLLVYKYLSEGTLHSQLHPAEEGAKEMAWPTRLKIGIGAARGLAWLHHNCNPRIFQWNISSKCILLDADFEPKISDFGLARLMNPVDTHLSTFVNGEFGDLGYVAPEYTRTLVAAPKGDVHSFGTVLLELVTGERHTHISKAPESFKGNLVEWITELSNNSSLHDAIDQSLVGRGCDGEIFQVLKFACNCVLPDPKERLTMFEVYQLLRAIGEKYHFTAVDDILMSTNSSDVDNLEELIVA
ncbi:Serine-threonine/tyrosine-protein kinase, catalytic domain [Dillenia turbinata]|uniref:Serine-threonine/tyrosine-protein kinase, catalytic domain n=1 Tax=Dillenia turbinata TaxID=194707 RepID=A0AAN8ZNH8_9MAGN